MGLGYGEVGVVVDEDGDFGGWVQVAEPRLLVDAGLQVDWVEGVVEAVDIAELFQQDEDLVAWLC